MQFPRLYLADKVDERPLGSSIKARKSVGISLVPRCERLYLLAAEKQASEYHVKVVFSWVSGMRQ